MTNITLGVLAGGQGMRMGGVDKALMPLNGKPMIAHVLERLPYPAIISANNNHTQYAPYNCRVVADEFAALPGPLNGIATLLKHCASDDLLITPCDALPPPDLLERLQTSPNNIVIAGDGERAQYCCGLFRGIMHHNLLQNLLGNPPKSVRAWLARLDTDTVHIHDRPAHYWNINTPTELAQVEHDLTNQPQ